MTLLQLIKHTGAFRRGHFQLASGAWSDVYIDCRRLTMDHQGLYAVTSAFLDVMFKNGITPKYIGGPATAAIPILAAMILRYPVGAFYVRKEMKEHGLRNVAEGNCGSLYSNCIIFDDVATSGESIQLAVDYAESLGCHPLAVMVIVDRQQGARERFEKQNIPFFSLTTLEELKREM